MGRDEQICVDVSTFWGGVGGVGEVCVVGGVGWDEMGAQSQFW